MSTERQIIRVATGVVLLLSAVALLVVWDDARLGAAMFAIAVSVGAVFLNLGRRFSELDSELRRAQSEVHRAKYEAEVLRMLESIDRRLAALSPGAVEQERE